jgi:uncharacterized protein (DUF433 family)
MPVSLVFENLELGASIEEIMEWHQLRQEQILTVSEFAARVRHTGLESSGVDRP